MTSLFAALLGVIQGLTEFLPVSSSAHLILARAFFGWDAEAFGIAFDVACHVGTLLAVLVFFRRDVGAMVASVPKMFSASLPPPARLSWLIAIGTLPAVAAGLLFEDVIETRLRTPLVAAAALAAVALAFFLVERASTRLRDHHSLLAWEALLVGTAQAVALVPGVSRSGATIVIAMALGLRRDEAARFAFLLGIPAILGAAVMEGTDLARAGLSAGEGGLFLIGMATSALVGYFTVKYFIRYLGRHSLAAFAWYRLLLAAAVGVWWLAR